MSEGQHTHRDGPPRGSIGVVLCAGCIALTACVCVLWPAVGVLRQVLVWTGSPDASLASFGAAIGRAARPMGVSVGISALIAAIASVFAWPVAGLMASLLMDARRRTRWVAGVFLLPLCLPHMLPYWGFGVLRSPETWLGDLIVGAAHDGARWLPVMIGNVLAVLGMAIWCAPIAAAVQAAGLVRTPRDVIDGARLDGVGGFARSAMLARMHAGAIGAGAGVVLLLMLGSAVPLHLAQLPTHAVVMWRALSESSGAARGLVWITATPALLFAAAAAIVLARALPGSRYAHGAAIEQAGAASGVGTRWITRAGAWLVFAAGAVVPLALVLWTVQDWQSVRTAARLGVPAMAASTGTGAWVGACVAMLAVASAVCFGSASGAARRVAAIVLVMLLASALAPGVMVGAATQAAWNGTAIVRDGPVMLVLAHLARFGVLGVLAGLLIERLEPASLRSARRMDGVEGVRAWVAAVLPRRGAVILASAAAGFALSLHEIEAAVMVQPPGPGNLARLVLDALHYARQDDLVGVLVLVSGVALVAGLAAVPGVMIATRGKELPRGGSLGPRSR